MHKMTEVMQVRFHLFTIGQHPTYDDIPDYVIGSDGAFVDSQLGLSDGMAAGKEHYVFADVITTSPGLADIPGQALVNLAHNNLGSNIRYSTGPSSADGLFSFILSWDGLSPVVELNSSSLVCEDPGLLINMFSSNGSPCPFDSKK